MGEKKNWEKAELVLHGFLERKRSYFQERHLLPVLLDMSVGTDAETAVSVGAEPVAAFAFELTAVDASEIVLL